MGHGINPHTVRWSELVVTPKEYYGGRIGQGASLDYWVSALEKGIETLREADIDKNLAMKLLSAHQSMLAGSDQGHGRLEWSLDGTSCYSPTMRKLGPVTSELVRDWC
ncbi:hypothetical protein BR93DRAFT_971371 [Coniochaeta sp. PMI_546]|nr:hypothetical protein BR93DRAFT_971371 [Coniochaeta sp. PMI_546]